MFRTIKNCIKEIWRRYNLFIIVTLIIIIFWVFEFFSNINNNLKLNQNLIAGLVSAFLIGIFLFKLDSDARRGTTILSQRLEFKKRALDCFEKINKLIIKIRFYNTGSYDDLLKDLRVDFDQIANFFIELQEIYKKLPGVIPDDFKGEVDKLDKFYQGWEKYFKFEKPEHLNELKESVQCSEAYLEALKKSLINFIDILRFE